VTDSASLSTTATVNPPTRSAPAAPTSHSIFFFIVFLWRRFPPRMPKTHKKYFSARKTRDYGVECSSFHPARLWPSHRKILSLWRMAFRCSPNRREIVTKAAEKQRRRTVDGTQKKNCFVSNFPPNRSAFSPACGPIPSSSSKHAIFRSFFASPRRPLKHTEGWKKGGKVSGFFPFASRSLSGSARSPVSE
jgi:hypothetical protein